MNTEQTQRPSRLWVAEFYPPRRPSSVHLGGRALSTPEARLCPPLRVEICPPWRLSSVHLTEICPPRRAKLCPPWRPGSVHPRSQALSTPEARLCPLRRVELCPPWRPGRALSTSEAGLCPPWRPGSVHPGGSSSVHLGGRALSTRPRSVHPGGPSSVHLRRRALSTLEGRALSTSAAWLYPPWMVKLCPPPRPSSVHPGGIVSGRVEGRDVYAVMSPTSSEMTASVTSCELILPSGVMPISKERSKLF